MFTIKLSDGRNESYVSEIKASKVISDLYPSYIGSIVAVKLDGILSDLSTLIDKSVHLEIIKSDTNEGLEVIRHSSAHLLAQAVQSLYPSAKLAIGPVIENGFYYDFYCDHAFSLEDLTQIELKMCDIVEQNLLIERHVISKEEALKLFSQYGEVYKIEIIEGLPDENVSIYRQGEWFDLCRGPHVPSTGFLQAVKLQKVSGSYWRGKSDNDSLQRIYGTAWANNKDLKKHLNLLEEAKKRDHRLIGKNLDLFHFQEESPGMVFWHPRGWTVYQVLRQYIRDRYEEYGYQEISTPQLVDQSLWQQSGHWDKFSDAMFIAQSEKRNYAVKPMSCPCHVQVYKQKTVSYKDLPIRFAEFGSCHRNEPSGTLQGLLRLRHFVQDDGHIFCREEDIQQEVVSFIQQIFRVYSDLGFKDILIKLSTRPEERVGSDEVWYKAEQALQIALDSCGLSWDLLPGEGAFYGPKIEFSLRDCLGRVWQCGTIQVDFSMPERLGASYIDEQGIKQVPVMLHRALLGTLERFLGILLEETSGKLPFWLSPVQIVVMNITSAQEEYALSIAEFLKKNSYRAEIDLRNEKIGFKIRQHSMQKIPYMVIVGDQEMNNNTLSIRTYNNENWQDYSWDNFLQKLEQNLLNFYDKE